MGVSRFISLAERKNAKDRGEVKSRVHFTTSRSRSFHCEATRKCYFQCLLDLHWRLVS